MDLSLIDRIIGREIGKWCAEDFRQLFPDECAGALYEQFCDTLKRPEPPELRALTDEDPLVEYPVLYLSPSEPTFPAKDIVAPPHCGQQLRLSEYLAALREFLLPQFTADHDRHIATIQNVLDTLELDAGLSDVELLRVADNMWRGRWIVGAETWAKVRMFVFEGQVGGRFRLRKNSERLQEEALRLIGEERRLKDASRSLNEWLHAIYCLLPEVWMWGQTIAWANDRLQSDELGKYVRILDEYQADIATTLQVAFWPSEQSTTFADHYAIQEVERSESVEKAIANIRQIYRGRTIIPRVWYESAKRALSQSREGGPPMTDKDYAILNDIDQLMAFGWGMTLASPANNLAAIGAFI